MTCGTEAAWKAWFDLLLAAFEFIELAAIVAMEMVMMFLAGNLVAGRVTWNLNRSQPVIFDQRFDIAIDSRDSQTAMMPLRGCQRLFQRERSIGLAECLADRVFLSCVPDSHRES